MSNTYKYFGKGTNYVILSDGNVARLLKPTKIHRQTYYNFTVEGKYKRLNREDLLKTLVAPQTPPLEGNG